MPKKKEQRVVVHDDALGSAIKTIETVLSDVFTAFDPSSTEKVEHIVSTTGVLRAMQLSSITRKKRQEKALMDLSTGRECVACVAEKMSRLEKSCADARKELKNAESSRIEASERVNELVSELDSSLVKVRETQAAKLAIEKELAHVQHKMTDLAEKHRQMCEKRDRNVSESHELQKLEEMARSNASMKEELSNTRIRLNEAKSALSEAQAAARIKETAHQKQTNVIARLTADNLVQRIRLNTQTKQLQQYETDVKSMRNEIETKRGVWFDEIRTSVETQLRNTFDECDLLRQQIDEQRITNDYNQQMASERECQLEECVRNLSTELSTVSQQLNQRQEETAKLQQQVVALSNAVEEKRRELAESRAEHKIALDTVAATREETSSLWTKNQELEAVVHCKESEIRKLKDQQTMIEANAVEWKERCEQHQRINEELMRRKESFEWQLMELKAAGATVSAIPVSPSNPLD